MPCSGCSALHGVNPNYIKKKNNKKTSLEKKEVEPVEPAQMNIYQSNTYRKDLSRPHFDD